jgi:threonine dehydratase
MMNSSPNKRVATLAQHLQRGSRAMASLSAQQTAARPQYINDIYGEILKAQTRLAGTNIRQTPVEQSVLLEKMADNCTVHLKMESEQITGSFKARGGMNKIKCLLETAANGGECNGCVTASTGNHALGVANAIGFTGAADVFKTVKIFLPHNAAPGKIELLKAKGAPIDFHGDDCLVTEMHAKAVAEKEGLTYVSPYADPEVVAGQGTIGAEVWKQIPGGVDVMIVPVGGGGLLAGIAVYLKTVNPDCLVIGAIPEKNAAMKLSLDAGHILDDEEFSITNGLDGPTFSEATAGGIEQGSVTFDVFRDLGVEMCCLSEEEIAAGTRFVWEKHHKAVEGAAGCSVAAFLRDPKRFAGKNVCLLMCGGNVSESTFMSMMGYDQGKMRFME